MNKLGENSVLPSFTRSTLPDPKAFENSLIVVIEPNGVRDLYLSDGFSWRPIVPAAAQGEATSRSLVNADNGKTLECTATITLTVPVGLVRGFRCTVIPSGTTSVARSGSALLNGAGTTLTRLAATAANATFDIRARGSADDNYVVTGV